MKSKFIKILIFIHAVILVSIVCASEGHIPEQERALAFTGKVGADGSVKVVFGTDEGESIRYTFASSFQPVFAGDTYTDAAVSFAAGPEKRMAFYWVRPNPRFTPRAELEKLRQGWDALPPASEVELRYRFVLQKGELQVWINDQLMHVDKLPAETFTRYSMAPSPESAIKELHWAKVPPSDGIALPVAAHSQAGDMVNPVLTFNDSQTVPAIFREMNGRNTDGIFIGNLGAFSSMSTADLQNNFWGRTASDGLSGQSIFTIPKKIYHQAKILCAVREGVGEERGFTFRVTRYARSRGNAMADSVVEIPPEGSADTAAARRVGRVLHGTEGEHADLWLLTVPIKNGLIADLLFDDRRSSQNIKFADYLDVELLVPMDGIGEADHFPPPLHRVGRTWMPTAPDYKGHDFYQIRPRPRASNVTVFGVWMEESPVALNVKPRGGFSVFYENEEPALIAELSARKEGRFLLRTEIADIDGKTTQSEPVTVHLKQGETRQVVLPLTSRRGWYAARVLLEEASGETLMDFRTSFTVLMPDQRKAGYESPFVAWWFGNNVGSEVTLEEIGPLVQRLGIRRADIDPRNHLQPMPESATEKYGFTRPTIGFSNLGGGRALSGYIKGDLTLEEAVAKHRDDIKANLEVWPGIDRMLVFHESTGAGAPFPTELWGVPANAAAGHDDALSPQALLRAQGEETPAEQTRRKTYETVWPKRMEYLKAMAKMVRREFPDLKMQFGNDGNSLETLGEVFRRKFPKELIDTIAVEDLGQTIAPERLMPGGLHSAWFLRELAQKMGYGEIPVTACTEWLGRMTEHLGLRAQAEWEVRDALISLAYGFDTISIAGMADAANGYYYSIWGNGGLLTRHPVMAPKPAYTALATLTEVLDRARHVRMFPTGSPVLYAQEFQRDKEWIYAVWTPRGTRDTALSFSSDADRRLIDLYGRERKLKGRKTEITAGTAAQYIVSPDRLEHLRAGAAAFPENAPENAEEIVIDSVGMLTVEQEPVVELRKGNPAWLPRPVHGKFEVREVLDEEMGKCIEVELIPEGEIWDAEHETVFLKFKKPISTKARNAGIWIKGNGSWGDVDIAKTQPWGPWAAQKNSHLRRRGDNSLNFEGWNFLTFPYYDWLHPVSNQVTGITLSLPRKTMVGAELQPVENLKVRIAKILLF